MCIRQLTEFSHRVFDFHERGFNLAALSVDEPRRSARLRSRLDLRFDLLCDTERRVCSTWGVLNPKQAGGVAVPSIFVLDRQGVLRLSSVGSTAQRSSPGDVLASLNHDGSVRSSSAATRGYLPRLGDALKATVNWLRIGRESPRGLG